MAIDGVTVAIGTPSDDTVMTNKGCAYVYGPNPRDQDSDGLLDAWELRHWPTTSGHGPQDDFDHDGYPELLELAFGLEPMVLDAGGLPAVTGGGRLSDDDTHRNIRRGLRESRAPGLWLPVKAIPSAQAPPRCSPNTATTLKVRDNFFIGAPAGRFMRVKVTAAP